MTNLSIDIDGGIIHEFIKNINSFDYDNEMLQCDDKDNGIINFAAFVFDKDDESWIEEGVSRLNNSLLLLRNNLTICGRSNKCTQYRRGVNFGLQYHKDMKGYIYIVHVIWRKKKISPFTVEQQVD